MKLSDFSKLPLSLLNHQFNIHRLVTVKNFSPITVYQHISISFSIYEDNVEAVEAAEVETAEFEVNTSSLKPSSGDTKTISQPAALAAKALSLTPITTFEVRVDVLGGGCGGCFLCSKEEMLPRPSRPPL